MQRLHEKLFSQFATLMRSSVGELLWFIHSTFHSAEPMKNDTNRMLWNSSISSGDERRGKRERDTGRARYALRRKLLIKDLEVGGGRVWAART